MSLRYSLSEENTLRLLGRYWHNYRGKFKEKNMKKIRFITMEKGILYLVTNWREVNGIIQFSTGKCWKFPLKKKRAA